MVGEYASAIYYGKVRHRRFSPKSHAFSYDVFMMYLDTSELDKIFSLSPFWSRKPWTLAQFKRSDFHIDKASQTANDALPSVDESIRKTVEQETGIRPKGPIRMLVNLRYWGYSINPISTYYCFDESEQHLVAIVAEVTNTPWHERHAYVLTGDDFSHRQDCSFAKKLHVSPFNPLAMRYQWRSTTPGQTLAIHLENWQSDDLIMDATMTLQRKPIDATSLHKILIHFPLMTVKIVIAIYWQALKLFAKRVPVFNHPSNGLNQNKSEPTIEIAPRRGKQQ